MRCWSLSLLAMVCWLMQVCKHSGESGCLAAKQSGLVCLGASICSEAAFRQFPSMISSATEVQLTCKWDGACVVVALLCLSQTGGGLEMLEMETGFQCGKEKTTGDKNAPIR